MTGKGSSRAADPVYVDVSDLVAFFRKNPNATGIQRVVYRLIQCMVARHGADAIRLLRWDPHARQSVWYDADVFARDGDPERVGFLAYFSAVPDGPEVGITLGKFVTNEFSGIHRKWRKWRRLPEFLSRILRESRAVLCPPAAARAQGGRAQARPFMVTPGVRILLGGGEWRWPDYADHVEQMRRDGAHVISIIYDLIPVLHPEYFIGQSAPAFLHWAQTACRSSAELIAISQCTKSDLTAFIAKGTYPPTPIHVVPLAHEFLVEGSRRASAEPVRIRDEVRDVAREPYILFAGTLEGRKNAYGLARAYEIVAKRLGKATPRLVMAGGAGWLNEDFDTLMEKTAWLDGLLTLVKGPSDAELAHLYANCLFFVFPSFYEGWGLPIGEALWHGRPVAASRTSSMPEVGGDLVRYFDPHDIENMADVIATLIEDGDGRDRDAARIAAARSQGRFRIWEDVAEDVWRILSGPE